MIKYYFQKIIFLFRDGFFHIFVGNTLTKMIAFLSTLVIVRLLSVNEYAYLTYVDNLYAYIGLFTGMGMSTAILRVCGPQTNKGEDKYYIRFSLVLGVCIQLLMTLFLIGYIYFVNITFPEAQGIIFASMFYPCMTYIIILMGNYLRAIGENRLYAYSTVVQSATILLGSYFLAQLYDAYGVVLSRYIGLTLCGIVCLWFITKQLKGNKVKSISKVKIKAFLKMSFAIMVADIFATIIPINELFLVSEIVEDEATTAMFKVAVLFPSQLMFVANSIIMYIFPKISQKKDLLEAYKEIKMCGIYMSIFVALIVVIGILINPILIKVLYGEKYLYAVPLSNVYWIVFGFNAAVRLLPIHMLVAIGKAGKNAVITGVTAVLHFIIFLISIKYFSLTTAAITSSVILTGAGLFSWRLLRNSCKQV